jgi:Ca2+-binding EF-hand superfamily protein
MNILVKTLNENELIHLKQQFDKIDKDQTGMISVEELKHALQDTDNHMSDEEINHMFDNIDYAGNKKINYTEFISATLSVKQVLT